MVLRQEKSRHCKRIKNTKSRYDILAKRENFNHGKALRDQCSKLGDRKRVFKVWQARSVKGIQESIGSKQILITIQIHILQIQVKQNY